ncbi:MAG: hypothetical protein WD645_05585 [Dehalococcoidia bacterium]
MAINVQAFIARFEAEGAVVRRYGTAISAIEAAIDNAFEERLAINETQNRPYCYYMRIFIDDEVAEDVREQPAVWREVRRRFLNAGFADVDFCVISGGYSVSEGARGAGTAACAGRRPADSDANPAGSATFLDPSFRKE